VALRRDELVAPALASTSGAIPLYRDPAPWSARAIAWFSVRAVVIGAAVVLLLIHLTSSRSALEAVTDADPRWLVAVVGLSLFTYLMTAVGLRVAVGEPLPVGRTMATQLAVGFANRLTIGGVGGVATNLRYLERNGADRTAALGALTSQWLTRAIVHAGALVLVLCALGVGGPIKVPAPEWAGPWVLVALAVAVVAAAVLVRWRGSAAVRRTVRDVAAIVGDTMCRPRRALGLAACSAGMAIGSALGLVVALHAVGGAPPTLSIAAVYIAGSAVAALCPTPGGVGAVEAALVAGAVGVGVPGTMALAGVLVFRFTGYAMSLVPGAIAYRVLRVRGHI
jgi:undecaprenyl-diphosphatase